MALAIFSRTGPAATAQRLCQPGSSSGPTSSWWSDLATARPQPHRDCLGVDEEEAGVPQLHQPPVVEGGDLDGVAGEDWGVGVPTEPVTSMPTGMQEVIDMKGEITIY